jgi:predicted transposase/invertase (TIGR01784 family)
VKEMLAERVTEWTKQWEQQGIEKGLEQGLEQGLEKGIEKGLEKGIEKARLEDAKNMLAEGIAVEVVARVTGLSSEIIEQLKSGS